MGEGVEDRAMFRQPERGKFLDVADDRLGDVASIEQGFVEERNWQGFHVGANARHENEPSVQKLLREFLADIALVAKELAAQVLGQSWHGRCVGCIAGCQFERDDLALMVEHDMQFEAEKPAHAGLSSCRQASENLVFGDASVVTDGQRCAVDVIDVRLPAHPAGEEKNQKRPHAARKCNKTLVAGSAGKTCPQ